MQVEVNKILDDFFAGNTGQLTIPVYQRNYDWNSRNVTSLMNDINTIIKTGKHHFFGVIVYQMKKVTVNGGNAQIIDGQQRLTTITLLLQALRDSCSNEQVKNKIKKYLTCNSQSDSQNSSFKLRLKLIKSDQPQYASLLSGRLNELNSNSNFLKNYQEAKRFIEHWLKRGNSPEDILKAINKLQVVGISIEDEDDDPQIIFESINSTGVRLSNSDLIRNFLLIDADNQQELFDDYWVKIENMLHPDKQFNYLDDFFTQFMIMNFSAKVTRQRVYQYFVQYYDNNFVGNSNKEEALKAVLDYAKIYSHFVFPDNDKDENIKANFKTLLTLNQTTCFPFFLQVFHDYEDNLIGVNTLEKIVNLITMFIIRRSICGYPVNTLRSIFASLYTQVFKVKKNKDKYYESINKYLFTNLGMPRDNQLKDALLNNNLYANKRFCRFLLLNIENKGSNEQINDQKLTIEHIMPQHLSEGWHISRTDHDAYLDRLGNLSLTGNNSKMSNKPFIEKKQILLKLTKIRILNEDLLDKNDWTINDIKARGEHLAKIIMEQYPVKEIKDSTITFENVDVLTLEDPTKGKGRKPVAVVLDGERYPAHSFRESAKVLAKILDQNKPNLLQNLVKSKKRINGRLLYTFFNNNLNMKGDYAIVRDGIYVQNGESSWAIMRTLKKLLESYGIDPNRFQLLVRSKNN